MCYFSAPLRREAGDSGISGPGRPEFAPGAGTQARQHAGLHVLGGGQRARFTKQRGQAQALGQALSQSDAALLMAVMVRQQGRVRADSRRFRGSNQAWAA